MKTIEEYIPTKKDLLDAAKRIKPHIKKTQVITSSELNKQFECEIFFKCENLQETGSFKSRGAINALFVLTDDEVKRGVATHSSGNHAIAVARAAKLRGAKAYVVMPENSAKIKVESVKDYGAEIVFCKNTLGAREKTLQDVIKKTGAIEIHPFDDKRIITGQATACMEFVEEVPNLNMVLVPVGGGGMCSGTAVAADNFSPMTRVIGVEPEQANDAYLSFHGGMLIPSIAPETIADGLLTSLGDITFQIILEYVHSIVTVDEQSIEDAMKLVYKKLNMIIEPSAAVPLAALLQDKINVAGKKVGIILCGSNVDKAKFSWMK